MAPGAAVFCPECGSKNKPGWEFCARCGGTLKGATSATAPRPAAAPPRPEGSGPTVTGLLGGIAVVALTAAAWIFLRAQANAPAPSADIFSVPRVQAAPTSGPSLPDRPEQRQARQRLSKGDFEGAVAALADEVAQNPEDAGLQLLFAQALWKAGQRDRALEHFAAAAALNPGQRIEYAKALENLGRTEEALEQYRGALTHDANNGEAAKALGNALLAAKRPAEAVAPLRRAIELAPNDILSAQQLAAALEGSGDLPAAEQAYRNVLARMPDATISRGRLAEVLQAQGRGQEAVDVLREGIRMMPNSPNLQQSLGSVLDRSGQKAEAAAAFREFLRLAPNSPEAARVQQRLSELGESVPGSAS